LEPAGGLGLEGHGVSRDVSSLRDSPLNLSLPGTAVPGYRLFRPSGTASLQTLKPILKITRTRAKEPA
jgi:hypothetical protein